LKNRRNFYRILHVQPEAPPEVIKASYRSLMTKLKAHPDLGGDHETAVLINLAYAVLSDPERRRRYDESLRSMKARAGAGGATRNEGPFKPRGAYGRPGPDTNAYTGAGTSHAVGGDHTRCPFCGMHAPGARGSEARCGHCASPLAPLPLAAGDHIRELFGRRSAPRISKAAALRLYPSWPHQGLPAQLRDVSCTGISLLAHYHPRTSQILKFEGPFLSGIARVVSVRNAAQGAVSIHASLLTAELATRTGAFVSDKA